MTIATTPVEVYSLGLSIGIALGFGLGIWACLICNLFEKRRGG